MAVDVTRTRPPRSRARVAPATRPTRATLRERRLAPGPLLGWPHWPTVLLPSSVVLWLFAVRLSDPTAVSAYGLVTALHPLTAVAVVLLVVSFASSLWKPAPNPVLALHLILLVLLLHGLSAAVQPEARFATGYVHAGFAEYVVRTGDTIPHVDARASWPGFYVLSAFVAELAGQGDAEFLLRWASVVWNALVLLPLWYLAVRLTDDHRVAWIATWVFVLTNWVGQDYFAPQAMAFFLFLVAVVIAVGPLGRPRDVVRVGSGVLQPWGASPLRPRRRTTRRRAQRRAVAQATSGVLVLALVAAAIVVSHQLTPGVLFLGALVLVATRLTRVRAYPALVIVLFLAWLSFAARPFWQEHLQLVFGGVDVEGSIRTNLVDRFDVEARRVVNAVRIGVTLVLGAMAGLGALRRWRVGPFPWPLVLLAAAPLVLFLSSEYGGEILLRIAFFAAPFLAVLAGWLFLPRGGAVSGRLGATLVAVSLVLAAAFVVARFGNEQFERIPEDLGAASRHIHEVAAPGSLLAAPTAAVPLTSRGLGVHEFDLVWHPDEIGDIEQLAADLTAAHPEAYVFLSDHQRYQAAFEGTPPEWIDELRDRLLACDCFEVVFSGDEGVLVFRAAADGGPP